MQAPTTHTTSGERDTSASSDVTAPTRELAARDTDGIHVLLLWHPRDDKVTVSVEDSREGARFALEVRRDLALDAFYHPFAYAA